MTVGAELRAARARAGMSLAELGERVGVSAATLSRWETGRGTPTEAALERSAVGRHRHLDHERRGQRRVNSVVSRFAPVLGLT